MNANVVENDENGCALDVQPCMPCLCMPCLIFAILHTSQIVQSSFALKCIERQCLAISHSKATVNADETENATLGHFWNCACPIRATHTSTSMIPQNISKHVQSRKTSFLKIPRVVIAANRQFSLLCSQPKVYASLKAQSPTSINMKHCGP